MINTKIETPSWLDGENKPQPAHLISFPNGLLDLRDNRLHPPDPSFFTTAALGFNYVAEAPPPVNWSQFLSEIYAGDDCENEMQQVQEIFGYLLTADVSHQKAFFFIGPKRSGKGTMLRMLQHLLAPSAVAGPTLKSLGSQFGLQPLDAVQFAFAEGWHEDELQPRTGLRWRWSSGESWIQVWPVDRDVRIRLAAESPLKTFDEAPIVTLTAGARELARVTPDDAFAIDAIVPADVLRAANGRIVLRSSRTFVPADHVAAGDPRRGDHRALGLRVFEAAVTDASRLTPQ
jgi:energy-coupling factor transporter ATP-binding protein EcfA2